MTSRLFADPECGPALAAKVAFLKRRDTYAEVAEGVEVVETHMSWVFLVGERVYKLKKPVRTGFLDFSTPAARRRNCEAEVRLNRRLAPGVYLGVVPLTRAADGGLALGGEGPAVDWLVRMRRLPRERMLDEAIRRRRLGEAELCALAGALAAFYRAAPRVAVTPVAYRARFKAGIGANRRALATPAYGLPAALVRETAERQLRFLAERGGLLEVRAREGRIVEGHGDLRPEHVCLTEPPLIIDRLEFRRDFRLLDPAEELAFLAMECEALGAAVVGRVLFATYTERLGDAPPAPLIRFYMSHRAALRAKLAAWHLDDRRGGAEAALWRDRAAAYLRLAAGHARALFARRAPPLFEQLDE
ncbi:MAG: hypothetical protein HY521_06570 [Proteobacteria bacterium]|nr:hypothetical protein [Pseudomonadota bacterium]